MNTPRPAGSRSTALFPLWAVIFSGLACLVPGWFTGAVELGGLTLGLPQLISPLLMAIMFCMGLTLTPADFARVLRQPQKVALGVCLQFGLMPLVAWLVGTALRLPAETIVGMVVVGATAGGTASNVITWLAGGRVALSIGMTLTSTLLAVVATPLLTELYVGRAMPVPVGSMMLSIVQIVLGPVVLGIVVKRCWGHLLEGKEQWLALISMACIITVIATVVALNRPQLLATGPLVLLAVVLHNLVGLGAGYWGARWLGSDEADARTVAIEVGMQNSGLAVVLANTYFGAAAALPGAIFSIWHNISGSMLAGYWARRVPQNADTATIATGS